MSRFDAIDLSHLAPPDVVETLDYEAILSALRTDFEARWEARRAADPDLPAYDVAMLETDPAVILMQAFAYREMLLRSRINDAARAVLLATSRSTSLDHLGARFATQRLAGEQDAAYRRRIQLAYEALSTAGPYGAYVYHALAAHPHVRDAGAYGPESGLVDPGQVLVAVLSSQGDGTPSPQVLAAVAARLDDKSVRPLTDQVIVAAAALTGYTVEACLRIPPGPDPDVVEAEARARVSALADARHAVGGIVPLSGLYAALHLIDAEGRSIPREVVLASPAADVGGEDAAAPWCSGISLTVEVVA